MHVLFLAQHLPWPVVAGWQQRTFHTARLLAEAHRVTFVTFAREPEDAAGHAALDEAREALARELGCEQAIIVSDADCGIRRTRALDDWTPPLVTLRTLVDSPLPVFVRRWWSEGLAARLATMRRAGDVDVVWANRPWMAEHALAAGFDDIVVDVDDLVSEARLAELRRGPSYRQKPLHYAHALKAQRYERRLAHRFPRLVVCKEEDRQWFPAAVRDRVRVVPNGVLVPEAPAPEPTAEEAPRLLFVGKLDFLPNIDAVRTLVEEVLPAVRRRVPDVVLDVVGSGNPGEVQALLGDDARHRLHVAPADLRPFYAAATVVTAPVRLGSGTRIKLLEALAWGKPLVATRFAAGGIALRDGEDVLFADAPDAFAEACVALLGDPERRRRLGASGRGRVQERYDWRVLGPTVRGVVELRGPAVPR
jgi:glycosyltransferase involved in cell wall biosynthesis